MTETETEKEIRQLITTGIISISTILTTWIVLDYYKEIEKIKTQQTTKQ